MSFLSSAMRAAVLQPSRRELVTPAADAVVSLAEIKAHVGQKLDDDDVLLQAHQEAAHRWAEEYMGRSILRQTWREWFDGPFRSGVLVLREQAIEVTSLKVYDRTDAETTVATTVYQADTLSMPSRLVLRDGQTWPVDLREVNAIAVEYTAGWATRYVVPELVKAAIVLFVAHRYAHREPVVQGSAVRAPYGIEALLAPYRLRTGVA